MNSTSLYVSTCRLVLQADSDDPTTWTDLYRLVPYLRQSLSCTVCSNLLIEPFTPTDTNCQHHVCKSCQGGKKKLKPSCSWCKNYDKYVENVQLRILMQCYKKLCEYITSTDIYRKLPKGTTNGGTSSLVDLINEGAGFKDEYKSTAGLSKSAYSILPCVYTTTSTSTQTQVAAATTTPPPQIAMDTPIKTVSNGSSLYSVMYASGNKITIKRKAPVAAAIGAVVSTVGTVVSASVASNVNESASAGACIQTMPSVPVSIQHMHNNSISNAVTPVTVSNNAVSTSPTNFLENDSVFKKPKIKISKPKTKKKGCRCGNATATPGKLTCCGQRCPCYVEAKACVECRCRGCRNPHRPGGKKVRPHIPELHSIQIHLPVTVGDHAGAVGDHAVTVSPTTHQINHAGSVMVNSVPVHSTQLVSTLQSTSILEASEAGAATAAQVLGVHPQLVYAPSSTLNLQNVSSVLPAALLVGDEKSPSNSESESENSDVDIDVDV